VEFLARPEQLPPQSDWQTWLFLGGRGAGKTWSGSQFIRSEVKAGRGWLGLIAPTAKAARDVMIDGPGGILTVSWEHDRDHRGNLVGRPVYEPSKARLTWENGATATIFSAEEPDRLRGPQHEVIWADELAAWDSPDDAWDMAMLGLRTGPNPRAMVSTTPRPIPIIRELLATPTCVVTRATTYANRAHLAPTFLVKILAKYEGTRLGRQELEAQVIDDVDGALWTRSMIRHTAQAPDLRRVVVAIDPAVSSGDASALTGIVVAAVGVDGRGYVLEDVSGRFSPHAWAARAVQAYETWSADRIVAEGNQGGEMVRHTIQTVRENLPVTIVHASRGKQARAEPVAALYEQGKVFHVKRFPVLEDQLCTWEPLEGQPSPDRLDALVWAFTDLMIDKTSTYDSSLAWVGDWLSPRQELKMLSHEESMNHAIARRAFGVD
jgi:phage terminase large subunit-like protein